MVLFLSTRQWTESNKNLKELNYCKDYDELILLMSVIPDTKAELTVLLNIEVAQNTFRKCEGKRVHGYHVNTYFLVTKTTWTPSG